MRRPRGGSCSRASPCSFSSPLDARGHGIEVVPQDLALADAQPVYMNVFLGRELVRGPLRRLDRGAMAAAAAALLDELDVRIDSARAPVRDPVGRAAAGRRDRARRAAGRSGSC